MSQNVLAAGGFLVGFEGGVLCDEGKEREKREQRKGKEGKPPK